MKKKRNYWVGNKKKMIQIRFYSRFYLLRTLNAITYTLKPIKIVSRKYVKGLR